MGACSYRTNAWPATPVRNAKSFVQIKVRNVATEFSELGKADNSVGVSTVDVNLATCRMNRVADVNNLFFEDAVGRRIRDHQRAEIFAGLVNLRF